MTAQVEAEFYRAWRESGASDKVLLALVEAGIVESGMRELTDGDRDSLGPLQQRAPWGTAAERIDAYQSAKKFINKAKAKEKAGQTAGQLAQAVQVSAYPLKYDAAAGRAQLIIARMKGSGGSTGTPATPVSFGGTVDKLTDGNTWWKFGMNVLGFLLILIGILIMIKQTSAVSGALNVATRGVIK